MEVASLGDPKKQRKKYETPRHPWRADVLAEELKLLGQYGLRNKRELWRVKAMLTKYRTIARSLLGMPAEQRAKLEKELMGKLYRLGIIGENAILDEVLDLKVEDFLERRLQTMVYRLGLAKTIYQARQLIVHGHIAIGGRKVTSPGYMVKRGEEDKIGYSSDSPLQNPEHPLRVEVAQAAEVKAE